MKADMLTEAEKFEQCAVNHDGRGNVGASEVARRASVVLTRFASRI